MRVALVLSVAALAGVSRALGGASLPVAEPSYVVQIHASRDGFVQPLGAVDASPLRTQLMTTESGQRFECFLPLSPLQKQQQALERAAAKQIASAAADSDSGAEDAREHDKFVAFARAAAKKIRPMCLQYIDVVDRWVYEICPGVLIRKVSLKRKPKDTAKKLTEEESMNKADAASVDVATSTVEPQDTPKRVHEVQELAAFESDDETKLPLAYEEFTHGNMQDKLSTYKKPMYTQVFHARGAANGQVGDIHVQFFCSASARDDAVAGVDWRFTDGENTKEPAAFAIASRLFCSSKHSDPDEKFSVGQLLQPLVDMRTCIKRNEGWWTYEFCFGQGIRQYHRENDGKVTAEFSLGVYDEKQNELLDSSGESLLTEHIDATHDSARPAYVEAYGGGTHCKEFDVSTPRKSRVYFFCSQGTAHHIMSVKESQTCTYTIKISSPVVCDHPHFITEEEKTEDKAEVVHCIPVATHDDENTPVTTEATRAPSTAPPANGERSEVVEVEVLAT